MSWLLTLPVFLASGWVWYELSRLYRRNDYSPAAMHRFRRQGFVAIGVFELSVASAIVALGLQEDGTFASAFPVGVMGIGFIVAGLWHPFDRMLP